jgi:HD superfamily phosphohydrolase YqeK
MTRPVPHPILLAAAHGELPDWARIVESRVRHVASVAALLQRWAEELDLAEADRLRWAAAGWLHDALRDADPDELAAEAGDYPRKARHGPAVAERLRSAGVDDEEFLEAVKYHSLGCRGLRRLGRFLYLADYLEPLRPYDAVRHAALRARLPNDHVAALKWVCARRIGDRLRRGRPLHPDTVDFWNELLGM